MPVQPLSPKQIKALRDKRGRLSSNALPIAWLSLPRSARLLVKRNAGIRAELPVILETNLVLRTGGTTTLAGQNVAMDWQRPGFSIDVHETILDYGFRLVEREAGGHRPGLLLDPHPIKSRLVEPDGPAVGRRRHGTVRRVNVPIRVLLPYLESIGPGGTAGEGVVPGLLESCLGVGIQKAIESGLEFTGRPGAGFFNRPVGRLAIHHDVPIVFLPVYTRYLGRDGGGALPLRRGDPA